MQSSDRKVPLKLINQEDKTFQITAESSFEAVADSIARIGLLHSPVLLRADSGYQIISGFRRIMAYRALERNEIEARILEPDTDKKDCINIAIADNSMQRPLNPIEASRALVLLSSVYPENSDLCRAASFLRLPVNPSLVLKTLRLSFLGPEIQEGVISDIISMTMALELGKLDNASAIEMIRLFGNLKLGLNKQREILTIVKEIAFRERISVEDVLSSPEYQQILSNENWDRSKKTVQLRHCLKRRRYPSITKAELEFEKNLKTLKLGSRIKLVPPRDFEGTTFSFELNFSNINELKCHLSFLTELSSSPFLKNIISD